jgi:hypothetical protein
MIWSTTTACAAFELLTGAPPFRKDDAMAVIYAQVSEPPPQLTSRQPGLPPQADQVFARALAKAPQDRYANCQAFAHALCEALAPAPDPPRNRKARPTGYERTPTVAAAAGSVRPATGGKLPTHQVERHGPGTDDNEQADRRAALGAIEAGIMAAAPAPGTTRAAAHGPPTASKSVNPLKMDWWVRVSAPALLIVIIGAGYAGWRYTQAQYYVGDDGGHVAIFRGINHDVAGLGLSSVYQRTGIPTAGVPTTDQAKIRSTIGTPSLAGARSLVGTIRGDYQGCLNSEHAISAYQARLRIYTAAANAYKKKYNTLKPVKVKDRIIATPPKPPRSQPTLQAGCPAPPAK